MNRIPLGDVISSLGGLAVLGSLYSFDPRFAIMAAGAFLFVVGLNVPSGVAKK